MRTTMLILAGCLLAGCATETLRMDVPADLALRGEEIPVASRIVRTGKSPVKFGRYLTSEHYGWSLPTTTTSGHNPYASVGRERMRFGFTLLDDGKPGPQARCHASQRFVRLGNADNHLDIGAQDDVPELACEIGTARLSLWHRGGAVYGELARPGATALSVRADESLQGLAVVGGNPLGYVFSEGKRDVMAVDLTKPGTVWLDRDLDAGARASLAAAAAALLMLQ